jgi:hypothetical protein
VKLIAPASAGTARDDDLRNLRRDKFSLLWVTWLRSHLAALRLGVRLIG